MQLVWLLKYVCGLTTTCQEVTPLQHPCQDHRCPATSSSSLCLILLWCDRDRGPSYPAGPHQPCQRRDAAASLMPCPAAGVFLVTPPTRALSPGDCRPQEKLIAATLEAAPENSSFLMKHQVRPFCFLTTSENIYSIKRSITSPTCYNGLSHLHVVLHGMLGDAHCSPKMYHGHVLLLVVQCGEKISLGFHFKQVSWGIILQR